MLIIFNNVFEIDMFGIKTLLVFYFINNILLVHLAKPTEQRHYIFVVIQRHMIIKKNI